MNLKRLEQIKLMLKETPNDAFLLFALAQETIKTGSTDDALKIYKKLSATNPDYVGTYYHLGKLLEDKAAYAEAQKAYETGIEKAQKKGASNDLRELLQALNNLNSLLD